MKAFDYKKAVQILNLFAEKEGGDINKMKAIKLVWLSDRLHLRKYGRTITGDIYFALPHGPVASTTRDLLEQNNFSLSELELSYVDEFLTQRSKYIYGSIKKADLNVFSDTEESIIDIIYAMYGRYDQFQLRDKSHEFPEWKKYESALEKKLASRFQMEFSDFFVNCNDEGGLFVDSEGDINISKEIFFDSMNLRSIF